jgi:hypothetical protein
MIKIDSNPVPVTCSECSAPAAVIERGCLVIVSRHHSERHRTVISLDWLKRLLETNDANLTNENMKPSGAQ